MDSHEEGYSNRLDLDRFFYDVQDQVYTIVKLEDFPDYHEGSDIDVFCYNKNEFGGKILRVGNSYLDRGFEVQVSDKGTAQTYIDFYFNGELDFRFDLYQSLPAYRKVRLKKHYFYSVIENASALYREYEGTKYPIYVPSTVDELVLRYVEYLEWYEMRSDKIKHLDYILAALQENESRIGFLDKLHAYTELPNPDYEDGLLSRLRFFRKAKSLIFLSKRIRSIPLHHIPRVVVKKLRST